jgi:hypothetical protein
MAVDYDKLIAALKTKLGDLHVQKSDLSSSLQAVDKDIELVQSRIRTAREIQAGMQAAADLAKPAQESKE